MDLPDLPRTLRWQGDLNSKPTELCSLLAAAVNKIRPDVLAEPFRAADFAPRLQTPKRCNMKWNANMDMTAKYIHLMN